MKCNCRKDCNCTGCSNKDLEIAYLKDKINKAYSIIRDVINEDNIKAPKKNKFIQTDEKVSLYTGLPNKACFDGLCKHLQKKSSKIRHWKGSKVILTKVKKFPIRKSKKIGKKGATKEANS